MKFRWEICHAHKTYKGAQLPNNPCVNCWAIYLDRLGAEPVTGTTLLAFLDTLETVAETAERNAIWEVANRLAREDD